MIPKDLITVAKAALLARCSRQVIYNKIFKKQIKYYKNGMGRVRVSKADIMKMAIMRAVK